jgi:hypothetical protein
LPFIYDDECSAGTVRHLVANVEDTHVPGNAIVIAEWCGDILVITEVPISDIR